MVKTPENKAEKLLKIFSLAADSKPIIDFFTEWGIVKFSQVVDLTPFGYNPALLSAVRRTKLDVVGSLVMSFGQEEGLTLDIFPQYPSAVKAVLETEGKSGIGKLGRLGWIDVKDGPQGHLDIIDYPKETAWVKEALTEFENSAKLYWRRRKTPQVELLDLSKIFRQTNTD